MTSAEQDEAAAGAEAKMKWMYQIATRKYPLHEDTALRPMSMSLEERGALTAYVERRMDLPGPSRFLVCTIPGLQRAAKVSYHHLM